LVDRVKDAKGRFDISAGRFDYARILQSFWGAGGTWIEPKSHWDVDVPGAASLQAQHPGWSMSLHKMRYPHPMVDQSTWLTRWLGGAASAVTPNTHESRELLGWHPATEVATIG
jgi:hypothetical protein